MPGPPRTAALGTAYLLALFVVDVSSHLIDILALPLPRLIMGFSWSIGFGIAALLLMWPITRIKGLPLIGAGGTGVLIILIYWVLLEVVQGHFGRCAEQSLISSCLAVLLISQLIRLHMNIFNSRILLIDAFVTTVMTVSVAHLALLLSARAGVSMPYVDIQELVDRNSISMLLVVAVWLVSIFTDKTSVCLTGRLIWLTGLSVIHILINHARAAAVLLLLVWLTIVVRRLTRQSGQIWLPYIVITFLIMAVVSFSYPLLHAFSAFPWFGPGDDILSTEFRTYSNWLLLNEFMRSPLLGIGWSNILDVRAGGYISHTLYLMLLSAKGMIGVAPLLLWAGIWMSHMPPEIRGRFAESQLLIMATASFSNDLVIWYGMVLALAAVPPPDWLERNMNGHEDR